MRRQKGSAILISLVMLTVLTLIGISSANNAVLSEKMSANTHFKTIAYQASKSEIEGQYTELSTNIKPFQTIETVSTLEMENVTNPDKITIDTDMDYVGEVIAKAKVQGEIFSLGRKAMVTEINVESVIASTGAASEQIQGLQYILPQEN